MDTLTLHIPVSSLTLACRAPLSSEGTTVEAVLALTSVLTTVQGPALERIAALLTQLLHDLPADAPKTQKSALMRLIAQLDERREEAELAANPARRAGIERIGEHFARKANWSFTGKDWVNTPPQPEPDK